MKNLTIAIMLTSGLISGLYAQTTKTTSKTKLAKPKPVVVKEDPQLIPIPANAYYFKDSANQEAVIESGKQAIVITGSNNRVTIAEGNTHIFIQGNKNDINMMSADYIEITGDGNFVSWEASGNASGKPVIKDKGGYNNVGKRSSVALNKSEN